MGPRAATGNGSSSIDRILEKHWSALSVFDRSLLLKDLGIDGENEEILACKTIDEVVRSGQYDLPNEVRGRLIMAVTNEGFSKKEYERVRDLMRGSKKGPERGN